MHRPATVALSEGSNQIWESDEANKPSINGQFASNRPYLNGCGRSHGVPGRICFKLLSFSASGLQVGGETKWTLKDAAHHRQLRTDC